MSPEILRYEPYTSAADLWSVGCIFYEIVVGSPPFKAQNHIQLLRKIERSEGISFPQNSNIPPECKNLISRLLKKNVRERLTFKEFFNHPFLRPGKSVRELIVKGLNQSEIVPRKQRDHEYVFVDKTKIELNSFADSLTISREIPKTQSCPYGINRLHLYGFRFNTFSRPLNLNINQSIQSIQTGSLLFNQEDPHWFDSCGEQFPLIKQMTSLAKRALAVIDIGDARIADLTNDDDFVEAFKKCMSEDLNVDEIVLKESLMLYMKSQNFVKSAVSLAEMYSARCNYSTSISLTLKEAVEWLRNLYNQTSWKMEKLHLKVKRPLEHISIQKILFEQALDVSKKAAGLELSGHRSYAKSLYERSLYLLEGLMFPDNDNLHENISSSDRKVIQAYITKIHERIDKSR
jgi:serine/threonine protein kinase